MNAPIDPKAAARAWINKAEADFNAARLLLASGKDCPAHIVCFHAQQCVEKYLKAVLCLRGVDFPRIHDIGELVAMLPAGVAPGLSSEEQEQLTEYAVDSRYPGLEREIDFEETARTAKWMETARSALRSSFSKDML
jgi:HEPN domain-containing protein